MLSSQILLSPLAYPAKPITITTTVPVGILPTEVAIVPDGTKVYVDDEVSGTLSVIDTANNSVTATVPVGYLLPFF